MDSAQVLDRLRENGHSFSIRALPGEQKVLASCRIEKDTHQKWCKTVPEAIDYLIKKFNIGGIQQ